MTLTLDLLTPKSDAFILAPKSVSGKVWSNSINNVCSRLTDARTHEYSGNIMPSATTLAEAKNRKNNGKNMAKMASNHGPKDHHTVYKTQHLALTIIIRTRSANFSSVKF